MSNRRQKRRRAGPGALPVVLAVLALLLQALAPGIAAAQAAGGTRTVVLCTSMGEKTVTVPDDRAPGPIAQMKCHDCVMAAVTTVAPPSPDSLPIRYAAVVRHEKTRAGIAVLPARPPPRPPGQGPPTVS